ncbi:MAG: NAD(P)-dependent oxidoreductase [Ruminococcus sp.]|nr:NAD(P)-dependent oxidoreductase [Ruminococcus sp.]
MENNIIREDIEKILNDSNITWNMLDGKSIIITGATGLIGSLLTKALLKYAEKSSNPPVINAFVRNTEKAERIFREYKNNYLNIVSFNLEKPLETDIKADYIIHTASVTDSLSFVKKPVETIHTAINGTDNLLRYAVENGCRKFVYISSVEVYGAPADESEIYENNSTNIDTMAVRSSYSESKRMCENLCVSYSSEYNLDVSVIRLTQTIGAGIGYDDKRIFAEFTRCAIEKRNIILRTEGKTKKKYVYTADAIRAILTVLVKGKNGEAYNCSNSETYCSIRDMAELFASISGEISVEIQIGDINKLGYAPTMCLNLNSDKLEDLGWKPEYNINDMFVRMTDYLKQNRNEI